VPRQGTVEVKVQQSCNAEVLALILMNI